MRREVPLSSQVYILLFPFRAEGTDPQSWPEHVLKNLVPELRHEVHMFYGDSLSHTIEARFPGLDYASPSHRERLRRFPHHRRLFKAFDELGLTRSEICRLCDWEGTLSVKRRYEVTRGPIRETAGDYIFGGRAARAALAKQAAEEEEEEDDDDNDEGEQIVGRDDAAMAQEDGEVAGIEDDERSGVGADQDSRVGHAVVSVPIYHQPLPTSAIRGVASVNVRTMRMRAPLTTSTARPAAPRAAA